MHKYRPHGSPLVHPAKTTGGRGTLPRIRPLTRSELVNLGILTECENGAEPTRREIGKGRRLPQGVGDGLLALSKFPGSQLADKHSWGKQTNN